MEIQVEKRRVVLSSSLLSVTSRSTKRRIATFHARELAMSVSLWSTLPLWVQFFLNSHVAVHVGYVRVVLNIRQSPSNTEASNDSNTPSFIVAHKHKHATFLLLDM